MSQETASRIGLLGGAFNPPHLGHLRLAELALRALCLDEVRFVPTARSPHKAEPGAGPDARSRLGLLEAALAGTACPFRVEPIEIERGGTSYTVDTLEALCRREPGRAWILLIGCDQLPGLPQWRRMDRILELASLGVAPRPGFSLEVPLPLEARRRDQWSGAPGELVWLPGTGLLLSSSGLRSEISRGHSPEGLPIQVEAAIRRENYYL
ncbi:MAG TPA: nicotinate (nicotinamide) nucleotide adenylyltransferase [Holophaga sp.]|nr:nicotinate (nicotinamide) nucleotide adenylyltransferase [Holophaga sp.]HPS67221.1 nicotinate (nicotinamide) nucleotide adenylyltransferase [Holophaga sp.]